MRHENTLDLKRAVLVVVDVQEAFRPAIAELGDIAQRLATMVKAAQLLKLPILATEQSPQKLGRTVKEILDVLPADVHIVEKTAFSCCGATQFLDQLAAHKARQVILGGIETHVCMNQTAHDLLARGYQVQLLTDCTSSRKEPDKQAGLSKMRQSGVIATTVEMALFELMRDARHEQFRAVQKLIK